MMIIIITIIGALIFCLAFTALHGNIANQLDVMGVGNERLMKIFKGQWHSAGLIARIAVVIILGSIDWRYGIFYGLLSFTFYDNLINLWRGKNFFRFYGTCEKWIGGIDTDCIWLYIQDVLHIPPILVKLVFSLIASHFIWSL